MHTGILLSQKKCGIAIDKLTKIRKQLRYLSNSYHFCFNSKIRVMRHLNIIAIRYRMLGYSKSSFLQCGLALYSYFCLIRIQYLFKKIYYYYNWLLKKIQYCKNTLTMARRRISYKYKGTLYKRIDDCMITSAYGFKICPTMRRNRCKFNRYPQCYTLYWYQGIKFGTFVSFRCKFGFRRLRDRRRKRKLFKDYRKKLKKYEHSVRENMRLIRGKRKKPKKKHIVYYK